MTVPLQLDTARPDWRRQARSTGKCKSCSAKILWMVWRDDAANRDRWAPYDFETGALHHKDCPAREQYRTYREDPKPQALAAKTEPVMPKVRKATELMGNPEPIRKPAQGGLFGDTAPAKYGVD